MEPRVGASAARDDAIRESAFGGPGFRKRSIRATGFYQRHCEPTGRREAPPDDRLREAIHLLLKQSWIASSQGLLAMTL
jgi:hypothetical protein